MIYYNTVNTEYLRACRSPTAYRLFKCYLLDHSENVIADITRDIDTSQTSVNINYQQGLRRTCDMLINNPYSKYSIDRNGTIFVNKKFKIMLGIADVGNQYWFDYGVFVYSTASKDKYTIKISAIDKFGFFTADLNQSRIDTDYVIPANTTFRKLLIDNLQEDMGNGTITDMKDPFIETAYWNYKLPYEIKKTQGQYIGDIFNEEASILSADIYYDNQGRLTVRQSTLDCYDTLGSIWDYNTSCADIFNINTSYDLGNVVNTITVYGTSTANKLCSYTAQNTYVQSDLCVQNIGVKRGDSIEIANATPQRCRDLGNYHIKKRAMIDKPTTFNSRFLPHLDAAKCITIDRERFILQEIKCPLVGLMGVSACSINTIPFT